MKNWKKFNEDQKLLTSNVEKNTAIDVKKNDIIAVFNKNKYETLLIQIINSLIEHDIELDNILNEITPSEEGEQKKDIVKSQNQEKPKGDIETNQKQKTEPTQIKSPNKDVKFLSKGSDIQAQDVDYIQEKDKSISQEQMDILNHNKNHIIDLINILKRDISNCEYTNHLSKEADKIVNTSIVYLPKKSNYIIKSLKELQKKLPDNFKCNPDNFLKDDRGFRRNPILRIDDILYLFHNKRK